ncbi:hypothetical protein ACHQM5_022362 [Ranunculus cassubicifolius]
MTTQSTSRGSFVKHVILAPAPESSPCHPSVDAVPIRAPDDILKLLHRYVKWETAEDLNKAHWLYIAGGEEVANFDIGNELKMLKELYFAMKQQYDICIKEQYDICSKLRDESAAEDDIKYEQLNLRLNSIGNILSPVRNFIRILESAINNPNQLQELAAEYKDYSAVPSVNGAPAFRAPEDIMKLLHKYVDWLTVEDLDMAHELYTTTWRVIPDIDFVTKLDVLKDLYSAMEKQYDICMKQLQEVEIGDDVEEDDIKNEELNWRMSSIEEILSPVKKFIRLLESAAAARSVSKVAEYKDYKDYSGSDDRKGEKRKRDSERESVEEALLNLLTHLGGETSIDKISTGEFSSRWDGIVNDLCALVG